MAKIFLPIDGSVTSNDFTNLLTAMGVAEASILATRPHISMAVAQAQVGAGLSQFASISPVSMDAAQTSVPSAPSNDRGAAIS